MSLFTARRRHSRAHTSTRAVLRWESENGVFLITGQTLDVSVRGLAMETFDAVPEQSSVSCSVPALELYGRALVRYADVEDIHTVVSDSDLSEADITNLRERGVEVVIATDDIRERL